MPVVKALMAVGSWSLNLAPTTPRTLVDVLSSGYFGHIAIATGRHDPRVEGDSLLTSARYVGVLTGGTFNSTVSGNGPQLSGDGMETWLATPSKVGAIIETPLSYTAATFATVINGLLPPSVHAGTIHSIGAATYTGAFVWTDPRTALTTFAGLMSTGAAPTQTVEWRVNGNATLDAGHVSDLYVTTPTTAIVARDSGVDMTVRALPGVTQLIEDVKDFTDRVVVLAGGSGASTAVGAANIADVGGTNPYLDLYGNTVKMTRMVSASSVSSFNATAAAQTALLPYTLPRDQVKLTSSEYDIDGVLSVGDYTYVYDPDSGIVDTTQEIVFRGQRINPALLRVIELDWPVTVGMTVAYRDKAGNWYDLTDYVIWDTGDTTVVVGGYNRALVSTSEPVGPRPIPDTTIPGVPAFTMPFTTANYQSASDGRTKSQIQLAWSTPTNTDGTTMTDLDHYEIQYRPDLTIGAVNPTWTALNAGGYTWTALNSGGSTWNQIYPLPTTQWKVTFVAGGINTLLVQELTPGVTYDFQIRAVDTAQPPNRGAWSATTTFQASVDTIPPPVPDAPTVAANMASVQISWDCGLASGGTFNQAVDLNHVEIHGSYEPLFQPSNATKLGNLPANIGNITGQIPVVGSFTIPPGQPPAQAMYIKIIAVDETGNKSGPSVAAGASAVLWSNAYITDLSVSKLTAGTVTASIILGGVIGTALTGQRVTMDSTGFHAYDAGSNKIFDVSSSSPVLTLGRNASGASITLDTSQTYPVITMSDGVNQPGNIAFAGSLAYGNIGMEVNGGTFTPESPISSKGFMQLALVGENGTTGLQYVDTGTGRSLSAFELHSDETRMVQGDNSGNLIAAYRVGQDNYHYATGQYLNGVLFAGTDLFGAGEAGIGGFSSAAFSYGVTLASFGAPIPGIRDVSPGATTQGVYVSASSSTGFTAAWHTTTPTFVWYWLVRTQ